MTDSVMGWDFFLKFPMTLNLRPSELEATNLDGKHRGIDERCRIKFGMTVHNDMLGMLMALEKTVSKRKPSPDWKGGAAGHRNEVRRLERKRNPGKRVKKDLLAFFPRKFSDRKKMTRPAGSFAA